MVVFQMICAFGANLMYVCHGMVFAASGFLLPKLEDVNDGFGITFDEGSWVGEDFFSVFNWEWFLPRWALRFMK